MVILLSNTDFLMRLNCLIFPRTRNLFVFIVAKNQITVFIYIK